MSFAFLGSRTVSLDTTKDERRLSVRQGIPGQSDNQVDWKDPGVERWLAPFTINTFRKHGQDLHRRISN
jgi:hypothetical protein